MEELVEKAKKEDKQAFTNLILSIQRDLYCIAKNKIENEMQYPGTIKVTLIRETRVVEEAK